MIGAPPIVPCSGAPYLPPPSTAGPRQLCDVVKRSLRRLLPRHALPVLLQVCRALPATVNGKIDRALLARAVLRRYRQHPSDPPDGVTVCGAACLGPPPPQPGGQPQSQPECPPELRPDKTPKCALRFCHAEADAEPGPTTDPPAPLSAAPPRHCPIPQRAPSGPPPSAAAPPGPAPGLRRSPHPDPLRTRVPDPSTGPGNDRIPDPNGAPCVMSDAPPVRSCNTRLDLKAVAEASTATGTNNAPPRARSSVTEVVRRIWASVWHSAGIDAGCAVSSCFGDYCADSVWQYQCALALVAVLALPPGAHTLARLLLLLQQSTLQDIVAYVCAVYETQGSGRQDAGPKLETVFQADLHCDSPDGPSLGPDGLGEDVEGSVVPGGNGRGGGRAEAGGRGGAEERPERGTTGPGSDGMEGTGEGGGRGLGEGPEEGRGRERAAGVCRRERRGPGGAPPHACAWGRVGGGEGAVVPTLSSSSAGSSGASTPAKRRRVTGDPQAAANPREVLGAVAAANRTSHYPETSAARPAVPRALPAPHTPARVAVDWAVDLQQCVDAAPLAVRYADGHVHVFCGAHSHVLVCVSDTEARVVWERVLDDRVESTPCVTAAGDVVVGVYLCAPQPPPPVPTWLIPRARCPELQRTDGRHLVIRIVPCPCVHLPHHRADAMAEEMGEPLTRCARGAEI